MCGTKKKFYLEFPFFIFTSKHFFVIFTLEFSFFFSFSSWKFHFHIIFVIFTLQLAFFDHFHPWIACFFLSFSPLKLYCFYQIGVFWKKKKTFQVKMIKYVKFRDIYLYIRIGILEYLISTFWTSYAVVQNCEQLYIRIGIFHIFTHIYILFFNSL